MPLQMSKGILEVLQIDVKRAREALDSRKNTLQVICNTRGAHGIVLITNDAAVPHQELEVVAIQACRLDYRARGAEEVVLWKNSRFTLRAAKNMFVPLRR